MQKLEIAVHFESLKDPRMETPNKVHKLIDIVVLSVCAVMSGGEGWKDIHTYAVSRRHIFEKYLSLENGIPCDDTFRRVMSAIKPSALEECFQSWVRSISKVVENEVINVDGKTLRRSHDHKAGLKALHLVSAWASENQILLGQVAVDEKSNEITAIPKLLEMLELKGAIITIDAMGCQRSIAQQIVDGEGDYVIGLKGNQGTLHDDVKSLAEEVLATSQSGVRTTRSEETAHGRIEARDYFQIKPPQEFLEKHQWPGLKTIGVAVSTTTRKGKEETEVRYYLLTLPMGVKRFAEVCRKHWGIENSLHWTLDVTFNEDQSRIRNGDGAINVASIRRLAISLFKNYKASVRQRKLKAAWSEGYLFKVLGISPGK